MTGIYIHVPFCLRKCPYCNFYSVRYTEELAEEYTKAVCRNIYALAQDGITADTIYFGGGTPSLLTERKVYEILDSISRIATLVSPEITIEANPNCTDFEKLKAYRSSGVNRISFGVQSADDSQLRFLGRLHDYNAAQRAVLAAEKAGFDNISCDIMLGMEGQDLPSLGESVDRLLELPVSHLSAYMLKIEPGTSFDAQNIGERIADEDIMADLYLELCGKMTKAGFEHYEISNFAKNGARSRHNMKYWQLEPYIGIGPAAHSDYNGRRTACPADIEDFIHSSVQKNVPLEENIDRCEEYIMLSLRLSDGLDRTKLTELGGEELAARLFERAKPLESRGLLNIGNGKISLTDSGFLLSNSIIVHLLDC